MEQAGQAKSLTGQVLINDLATALDGHGGIKSITLNDDYTLTFIMSDDTEVQTTSVRGAPGAKGDKGTDGRAITSIEKIDTTGLVDTYKISFSDNTSVNFTVTNGASIKSIAKTGTSGLTDTYTVTLTDDTTSTFTVTNGNGIASITLQSGTHAAGTTDTYKITFTNGEYTTFPVYNGLNGTGSVVTVNDKNTDASGNVALTAADIPYATGSTSTVKTEINDRQMDTKKLEAETAIADEDAFPFYDSSEAVNRKTLWSNILAKIRAAFKNSPLAIDSGGTNGKTAAEARANLGALSSAAGSVGTSNLGDKVVTAAKIANSAVGTRQLATGAAVSAVIADKAVTAAKLAADAVKLTFTNKSVAASAFVSNSTYSDFPYRAAVTLTGVTAAMVPEVFFGLTDAMSGNFAPVAESYAGGIYIYAAAKPSATITIPTILCWR